MLHVLRIDESKAGPAREPANFVGRVRMQNFAEAARDDELESLAVFFDAGSRTRPHRHSTNQLLFFVRGSGFVVFPGEEEQRVPEGGLVVVPARLVHMHGATDEEPICHLAIRCPGHTDWHPPVPDEWGQFVA